MNHTPYNPYGDTLDDRVSNTINSKFADIDPFADSNHRAGKPQYDARLNQFRLPINDYEIRLNTESIPSNMHYAFHQSFSHANEAGWNPENIRKLMRNGWHLVYTRRHPEVFNGNNENIDDEFAVFLSGQLKNRTPEEQSKIIAASQENVEYISEDRGLILMEKDKRMHEAYIREKVDEPVIETLKANQPEVFNRAHNPSYLQIGIEMPAMEQ
jgi:hypothetical protein